MDFSVETEMIQHPVGNIGVLKLFGRVDQKSVSTLEKSIDELNSKNICRIIIDLENTSSLNSTGLGFLINMTHQASLAGGGVCLINVQAKFKALFDALGLQSRLPILQSRNEALEHFSS